MGNLGSAGKTVYILLGLVLFLFELSSAQTIALWPFDEQTGIYPSCVISDISDNDYPLVVGPGGQIVEGKFGNALEPINQPPIEIPPEDNIRFGLKTAPIPSGRTIPPMSWLNAEFCALMTSGENHLRKEVGFCHPTKTKLNIGNFDWTIEFWYFPARNTDTEGIVFEIGQGPRGENNKVTQLIINKYQTGFILYNAEAEVRLEIPSAGNSLNSASDKWCHLAFVYDHKSKQLSHYVNGKIQVLPLKCSIESLSEGEEDYLSIGRDGLWNRPLPGRIDELRFSSGKIYTTNFNPPTSFSYLAQTLGTPDLMKGEALLFSETEGALQLGDRKHLFIDNALIADKGDVTFVVNPPRLAERVIANIEGPFRKHLNIVEDEDGLLRMYNAVDQDYLAVRTSKDGINWEIPELPNGKFRKRTNVVLHESTGMGIVFIDPNAPPNERWKYLSDYHRRGIFLFTSADGWSFARKRIAVLPFRSGSQSTLFYDDQRQLYASYHRSDFGTTLSGDTERDFVMTETNDILKPWPFEPVSQKRALELAKERRVHDLNPWYLDNGPLTPGGFAFEYPWVFTPDDNLDPRETDVYVPKAIKYPWAPDTYLAFPVMYFHYEETSPLTRMILMDPDRKRGSGPIETQLSVSRDGIDWERYPRPVYIGNGQHQGWPVNQAYLAHGMVKRGHEIWQYYYGTEIYHSTWSKDKSKSAVYRVVQRLDGFVSADGPYDKEATMISKPLIFKGNRLVLNIDTDASGYAQIGFLDKNGRPVKGFSVDDCVYINGDFIETEVEWFPNWNEFTAYDGMQIEEVGNVGGKFKFTKDLSSLEGKEVQIVFRLRGCKLYGMQFVNK